MSNASPTSRKSASSGKPFGAQSLQKLESPARFVGFWMAVITPFVLLGLLASGVVHQSPLLLSGLLSANVGGLVLGRDYKR